MIDNDVYIHNNVIGRKRRVTQHLLIHAYFSSLRTKQWIAGILCKQTPQPISFINEVTISHFILVN